MATLLRMPGVVANATEAVLATWLVAEGQAFFAGDPLAEVETEKALVEIAAESDGILGRQLTRPGETVEVGSPIAVLIDAGETGADIEAALRGPAAVPDLPVPGMPASAPEVPAPTSPGAASTAPGRPFISPLARRLGREHGIDPAGVAGTGPGGRIVRRDMEAAVKAAAGPASAVPAAPGPAGYTAIPHTPMRLATARRLVESVTTVPHFYVRAECRVDALLALRTQIGDSSGVKVSVTDLVVKAAAGAFRDVPEANVTWSEQELRRYDSIDIAIAVATPGGLIAPVLRGVEHLGLAEVSAAIGDLVDRARSARLRQAEIEGGCFCVTNLGMYGTTEFSAIIRPPQWGILAIGAARPQAVVTNGAVVAATVMRCTLSVDHRAVNGALAARWIAAFTARIENPISILI